MANPAALCTHIKTNGATCGSPAVSGTALCYHHSTVRKALGKVVPIEQVPYGAFPPIPFVFPEDRASMQINYFLLLQALAEQRIDLRTANSMQRMLKAMAVNLGKSGSLVENQETAEPAAESGEIGSLQAEAASDEPADANEVRGRISRKHEEARRTSAPSATRMGGHEPARFSVSSVSSVVGLRTICKAEELGAACFSIRMR